MTDKLTDEEIGKLYNSLLGWAIMAKRAIRQLREERDALREKARTLERLAEEEEKA